MTSKGREGKERIREGSPWAQVKPENINRTHTDGVMDNSIIVTVTDDHKQRLLPYTKVSPRLERVQQQPQSVNTKIFTHTDDVAHTTFAAEQTLILVHAKTSLTAGRPLAPCGRVNKSERMTRNPLRGTYIFNDLATLYYTPIHVDRSQTQCVDGRVGEMYRFSTQLSFCQRSTVAATAATVLCASRTVNI